jgi:hypothetical protein
MARDVLAGGRSNRIWLKVREEWCTMRPELVMVRGLEGGSSTNRGELNYLSPNWRCHISQLIAMRSCGTASRLEECTNNVVGNILRGFLRAGYKLDCMESVNRSDAASRH